MAGVMAGVMVASPVLLGGLVWVLPPSFPDGPLWASPWLLLGTSPWVGLAVSPWVLLGASPWLLLGLFLALGVREPRALPSSSASPPGGGRLPSVTVIVPARNEARGIGRCVSSLADQDYPDFSVIVVDDRSSDGTAEIVREVAREAARGKGRRVQVIEGRPLPAGWFGKPWACHQGARLAEGELLLFTDADTWHHRGLLRRAVAGLREDAAQALTLQGRQELESFGERLVQPHFFLLIALRYPRLDRPIDARGSRNALASGQYILVTREVYREVGGHEALRGEVVEDLRLAQRLTASGHRLTFRSATDHFSTRMYHSLGEVVEGWTKNVSTGARQSAGRWGGVVVPGMAAFLLLFWIVPPAVLAGSVLAVFGGARVAAGPTVWAAAATGLGGVLWAAAYRRFDAPVRYAFLYPLGAAVTAFIVVRSGLRGEGRIEWKGRRYAGGSEAG